MPKVTHRQPYPPIADYGLIGDCHSSALVSRCGSIDWCCMPKFDSDFCFGRLLDWDKGGYCLITPVHPVDSTTRRYLENTLVLETRFRSNSGEVRLLDCFTMRIGGREHPHRQLLRIIEGVRGEMELHMQLVPRFDHGETKPWIRCYEKGHYCAIGSDHGLVISSEVGLSVVRKHDLESIVTVRAGERVHLSVRFVPPERLDAGVPERIDAKELNRRLEETIEWWRDWASRCCIELSDGTSVKRSAIVLKALTNAPTGAIIAAPTASLPETPGGSRNWDYRYSWIRDSCFAVRSLGELGYEAEADGFRRFIERSAAGSADELQIMYGIGGERRLTELAIDWLEGYRGASPVRIGNNAYNQLQLDMYGELLNLAWQWHERGHRPEDEYWEFLVDLVDAAERRWREPDCGIWEMRGAPRHFVFSKAMCWLALDRGIRLAEAYKRSVPAKRWAQSRKEIRDAIEAQGYDRERGTFVQAFGNSELDAALLLLPIIGFVAYDDDRMVRTVNAIQGELNESGLILRYRTPDDLDGREGTFLACTFWLAECLARQERRAEARDVFDRAVATCNDLGLFSEEYDPQVNQMLGNFPQGLTHLSHISAGLALTGH
jgi:GH15 family glucan-1,4-alpha-glucosidase